MKLNNTRLLVDDFPATFRFYHDVLGLNPSGGGEDDVYVSFETADSNLALFQRPLMEQALGVEGNATETERTDRFLLCFEVESVDASYAKLVEGGAAFITMPEDRPMWGIRTAHLRDQDGNLVELYTSMPHG